MRNRFSVVAACYRAVASPAPSAGVLRATVVVLLTLAFLAPSASAQTYPIQLNVGDILAAGVVPGSVVRIDKTTGVQTLIANATTPVSPNYITFATGVTVAPDGDVLVTDQTNGLIRINPITGAQTQVAHGANPSAWFAVTGVRVGNNISYYVADSGYSPDNSANYGGQILSVDLNTKAVTVVAQGTHACVGNPCLNGDEINHPFGLADDGNGNLIVSDMSSYGGQGAIFRIEQPNTSVNPTIDLLWGPSANTPQWASQLTGYPCPLGVTVQSSGDIIASRFVSNGYGCPPGIPTGLFRVGNPNPGDPFAAVSNFPGQTDFSVNGPGVAWSTPSGLDHDGNDDIFVADFINDGVYELLKTGGSSFVYNNACFQFAGTCGPPPSNIPFPVGVSVIRVNPPLGLKGGQAVPSTSCNVGPFNYNGQPQPAVCTATDPSTQAVVAGTWTITYNGSAAAPVNVLVGGYAVVATFAPTNTSAYSNPPAVNGILTINPLVASVTPNNAGKTYGSADPNPLTTGTLSGFLASDNVSATYSRVAGETVGGNPYKISAILSPAAVLGNYTITSNTANFSISPLAASVTPNNAGKIYGNPDPNPLTTGTLQGFLASDNVTATYSRTAGEATGVYVISATLSPAAVLGNYTLTYNTANFTIQDALPTITSVTSSANGPLAMPAAVTITANFTYAGGDKPTCAFTTDGAVQPSAGTVTVGNGSCTWNTTFNSDDVYTVTVTVTTHGGIVKGYYKYVVIYNPAAGWVSGQGTFISAPGSYPANPTVSGIGRFGFSSKYQRGASVPSGSTGFQLRDAKFKFVGTSQIYLTITGAKAQYTGSGVTMVHVATHTGDGDCDDPTHYQLVKTNANFILTAIDGDLPGGANVDGFRIKITDGTTNAIIYDNMMGTMDDPNGFNPQNIASGKVEIHKSN